jgi:hypothetical protein
MNDALFALQLSDAAQQSGAKCRAAEAFEDLRPDDQIGESLRSRSVTEAVSRSEANSPRAALGWREMDSNHRFRAITIFVSRPPRTSPVAMIL